MHVSLSLGLYEQRNEDKSRGRAQDKYKCSVYTPGHTRHQHSTRLCEVQTIKASAFLSDTFQIFTVQYLQQ